MMIRLLTFFILLLVAPMVTKAGGYKLGLQGVKQLGMGHTGIGYAQDAATIYFNPAGMCWVSDQVNASLNLLAPTTSFLEKNTNLLVKAIPNIYSPFSIYAKKHFGKRLQAGLGIYTPFGAGLHYPFAWSGRFILTDISLNTVFIQPTLAMKISERWSLGAAYILSYGQFKLEKDLPVVSTNDPNAYGHARLEGQAMNHGYKVGLYYHHEDQFNVGISYQSGIKLKVKDGQASFWNIPQSLYAQFPTDVTFRSTLPLPAELGAGFSLRINKKCLAAFDMNYTFWKTYDSLSFIYSKNTSALTDSHSPRLYSNSITLRAGVSYELPKHLTLRVGAFYDQTPTKEGYVGPELPDNNRFGFTGGCSYSLNKRIHFDLALLYEDVFKKEEHNLESNLMGTYKTQVVCPSIGLNYLFNSTKK